MKRWNAFMASLAFDKRVDFEEGDIGLAGGRAAGKEVFFGNLKKDCCDSHVLTQGIKAFEPTLAHPVTQVDMGCGNGFPGPVKKLMCPCFWCNFLNTVKRKR